MRLEYLLADGSHLYPHGAVHVRECLHQSAHIFRVQTNEKDHFALTSLPDHYESWFLVFFGFFLQELPIYLNKNKPKHWYSMSYKKMEHMEVQKVQ